MNNEECESTTKIFKTFRFASGQVMSLDEDQIAKIPYLTAMISSADRFNSARDEDGHYKLDPHINYDDFAFIIKSLSFHSIRQLFTELPMEADVIPIIALLDFLGLGPQPDPALHEIDSTFFSNVVYSPLLERHIRLVRLCDIRDMAVRFGIALAKEEYDLTKGDVLDQIYWYVMFILSTPKWFEPHLRHHVYKIAGHTFILFKRSLLKPLNALNHRSKREARKLLLTKEKQVFHSDEENNSSLDQAFELNSDYESQFERFFFRFRHRSLRERQNLLLHRMYRSEDDDWFGFWRSRPVLEDDLLEPTYRRALEIMYGRLQTLVCRTAATTLLQRINPYKFARVRILLPLSFDLSDREALSKRIDTLFEHESVQAEISTLILEELCILTPKLERRHAELLETKSIFELESTTTNENALRIFFYFPLFGTDLENMEKKALSHERLLKKLHQDATIVVKEMQRRVLDGLHELALKQFIQWENTQRLIDELHHQLNSHPQSEKPFCITSKKANQQYQNSVHKPLLKRQFKYSTR